MKMASWAIALLAIMYFLSLCEVAFNVNLLIPGLVASGLCCFMFFKETRTLQSLIQNDLRNDLEVNVQ